MKRQLRDQVRLPRPQSELVDEILRRPPPGLWSRHMARIRSIKPQFWTDEKTGTLSHFGKCLFLGLLGESDDYGVLRWAPTEWRAKIFPYDSHTTTGVVEKALVEELLPRGLLVMFSLEDDDGELVQYAFIKNFQRHQVINKPSSPLLPGWEKGDKPETYAKKQGTELSVWGPVDNSNSGSTTTPLPEGSTPEGRKEEGVRSKDKTDTSNSNGSEPALDDGFESFWNAYPRKEAKKKARQAWRNLTKQKQAAALADCAKRYEGVDKRFVPLPTTYLHGERWNDDPIPPDGGPGQPATPQRYNFGAGPPGKIGRAMAALNQGGPHDPE